MASVPVPPTFTAGQIVTAGQEQSVSAAINFVQAPPRINCQQRTSQACANGAYTAITWDTEAYDTDNMHSTTTNTTRVVANTAGLYIFSYSIACAASMGTGVNLLGEARLNAAGSGSGGSLITGSVVTAAGTGSGLGAYVGTTFTVSLNVNDYVEIFLYQNSGASMNTVPSAGNYGSLLGYWIALS